LRIAAQGRAKGAVATCRQCDQFNLAQVLRPRNTFDCTIGWRATNVGEEKLSERIGVAIALVSSALGGTAAAITRYLVGNADPIALAILRWGIGFACLLPTALVLKVKWPPHRDWPAVMLLGLCYFGLFFVLYSIAISFTTAGRASLALATLPLHTMVIGALLGIEPLTMRKSIGVCVAVLGVIAALASGLSAAPLGAWRGELIMTGAVLCMAFYSVWSRPFMQRSSALGFLTVGMGSGAVALVVVGLLTGSVAALGNLNAPQWIAGIYLGVVGGALAFILWVMALERATRRAWPRP
jgi:drug/metabolite transporter (DMT)-like permease